MEKAVTTPCVGVLPDSYLKKRGWPVRLQHVLVPQEVSRTEAQAEHGGLWCSNHRFLVVVQ